MKFKKSVALCAAILMAGSTVFGLAGCGGTTGAKEGELLIRYFQGGTGDVWLKNAARKFEERNEGITVKLEGNNDIANLLATQFNSGKDLADIYMLPELGWQEYVARGKVANLNDVYEAEVETSNHGKIKIKDYLLPEVRDSRYLSRVEGAPAMPWTMQLGFSQAGIIYNEDILLSTKHTTAKEGEWAVNDTWTAPPETVQDLLSYCADLNAVGKTPFSFAGNEPDWLMRLMFGWWAQYQGANELNTANSDVTATEGTFFEYWNYGSPEVFKQAGIEKAIDAFQSIFKGENGAVKNAPKAVREKSTQDAERDFVNQDVAMIVCGAFAYNEVLPMLDNDGDGKQDFTMKMMNLPYVDGAQTGEDGKPLSMNLYNSEDVIIVPAEATNVKLAKDFLILLCEEESLLDYTKQCGELRPFQYDLSLNEKDGFEYPAFTKSVIDIYNHTDVHLVRYPVGAEFSEVSYLYSYKQPLWTDAYTAFNGQLFSMDAASIAQEIYKGAQKEWSIWESQVS